MLNQAPAPSALTPIQRRIIDAGADILSGPSRQIDYLHTVQAQCSLPYRNPGDHVREWDRIQGNASLRIEAGSALDPNTRQYVKLGLPYGEKPRLILIHLASEAMRTGSLVIDVEDSMTAFAKSLGLDTNGRHLRHLKVQIARLAAATVRLGVVEQGKAVQVNTQIITAFDLWFPKEPGQRVLWSSTVRLSNEFYSSLSRHAVPLDHRAIRGICHSSLALDTYTWLAQRLHRIPTGKPQFIPWTALYEQFGQGYARLRDFRKQFLQTMRQVHCVYASARLDADAKGMTLYHSSPPITSDSARKSIGY